jgi:hypothetical protein
MRVKVKKTYNAMKVKVIDVEPGEYYSSAYASGNTVDVTLKRGKDFVRCNGILIFERELVNNDLFDEWVAAAREGDEGYTALIAEGNDTVFYGGK